MSTQQPAIRIEGLEKGFHTGIRRRFSAALRGLDLTVEPGQVFGFLGPNGAGKTTTIKILVGLLTADAGRAAVFGHTVPSLAARRKLAYLPELPDFYDYLNPAEFLKHCARLSGLEAGHIARRVPEVLERVGLDPDEKRPMRKFSKGMLQRCGIAQSLLADPDLYILDEPMGGLDPIGRRFVKDLIGDLGRAGKTVFFSSHVLAEAEAVCDRVAFLHRGERVAEGETGTFLDRQTGTWEVLVTGETVRADQQVIEAVSSVEPAGNDSLIRLADDQEPEQILPLLAERGHRLLSVQRHLGSLEDAFIRLVQERTATGGGAS